MRLAGTIAVCPALGVGRRAGNAVLEEMYCTYDRMYGEGSTSGGVIITDAFARASSVASKYSRSSMNACLPPSFFLPASSAFLYTRDRILSDVPCGPTSHQAFSTPR